MPDVSWASTVIPISGVSGQAGASEPHKGPNLSSANATPQTHADFFALQEVDKGPTTCFSVYEPEVAAEVAACCV